MIRDLTIRPIDVWPDGWRTAKERRPNPFKTKHYQDTVDVLALELDKLDARDAHLQVDIEQADLRQDGMLRAHAKVGHPGVILTVDSRRHGVLTYPCDTFEGRWSSDPPNWQINLRAIALGLEALRKVERYGIAERGQQYAGFGALPAATPMDGPMTVEDAARFIARQSWPGEADDYQERWFRRIIDEPDMLDSEFRRAAKRLHPDAGGDPALFRRLATARQVIQGTAP